MAEAFVPTRRHPRFAVELIAVSIVEARRRADRVVNLSAEGARLDTPEPLPAGTSSHFYFIVPDADLRITCIDVEATVAWSNGRSMGLRFERHLAPIGEFLTRLASEATVR